MNWRQWYVNGATVTVISILIGAIMVGTYNDFGLFGPLTVIGLSCAFGLFVYCICTMPNSNGDEVAKAETKLQAEVIDRIGERKFIRHDNKIDERADMIAIMEIMMNFPSESGMYILDKDYMNRIIYLLGEEDDG